MIPPSLAMRHRWIAWFIAALLLAIADGLWPFAAFFAVYPILLIAGWRYLPRPQLPMLTAMLMTMATLPAVAAALNDRAHDLTINLGRSWIVVSLGLAGLWFANLQRQRRRRMNKRQDIHSKARDRAVELRDANTQLLAAIAASEQAQRDLTHSQLHLASLIEHMQLYVIRKDRDGVFTYASPSFCQLLNRSPDEVVGQRDAMFYPTELVAKYRQDDLRVMEQREVIDTIEVNPHPDGSRSYVQVLKAPDVDGTGQVVGVQAVFWDVTIRQRSEAELRRSETRKRALFDAVGDGILLVDGEGRIVETNAAARQLLAADNGGLDRKPIDTILVPSNPQEVAKWPPQMAGQRRELVLLRQGQPPLEAEVAAHPIPLDEAQGWAVILRDITDRRAAARAMEDAKNAAEAANQAKSRFVAGVSHELRTPLGAVIGLAQLLHESDLPPPSQQHVALLSQSAEMLAGVIDDLLDFSKIEAEKLTLEPHSMPLAETIGQATKCLAIRAAAKEIKLIVDVDPGLPVWIQADSLRLRQVVMNLVGNAIKFTDRGSVRVRALQEPSTISQSSLPLILEVIDTGPGIAANRQAAIFDAFEQEDSSTTRRFGGTGLGLSITERLVRLMGGKIELESDLGIGSTFRCRLPLVTSTTNPANGMNSIDSMEGIPPPSHARPIDLVGLDEDEAEAIAHAILSIGRLVRRETIDTLSQHTERTTDSVPSDIRSPHIIITMQSLAERIASIAPRAAIIQIADFDEASLSDPAWTILRPALREDLKRCLQRAVPSAHRAADGKRGPPANPTTTQSLQILLVDDSPLNRTVIGDLLRSSGHVVTTASSGVEAICHAKRSRFDFVLMDLQMPEMDGIESAQRLREEAPLNRSTPMIALTAHAVDEYRERCLASGLAGYVTKPVKREVLLRAIEQVAAPATLDQPWLQSLAKLLGGRAEIVPQTVALLDRELHQQRRAMDQAIDQGDLAGVRRAAHTLKSALRYVDATSDQELAALVERAAAAGTIEPTQQAIGVLGPALDRWQATVRAYLLEIGDETTGNRLENRG
jgi:two-component system, sensor histidine kinase and response regulator